MCVQERKAQKVTKICLETFRKSQCTVPVMLIQVAGVPENVMVSKWLPQQDILAHPNLKVQY
jgi:hypothetical protein